MQVSRWISIGLLCLLAGCGGGGGGGGGGTPPGADTPPPAAPPPDIIADAFQFQRAANVTRGSQVTSNSVTIAGINAPVPVSVENGEYSIDGGSFTSSAGSIRAGQSLTVRARASLTYAKATVARVTVGSVTADFEVLAELPNYVPNRVIFDGQDTVYLLSSANSLILRWSLAQERYLDAYVVGSNSIVPWSMTYSSSHQRLYLGYATGEIKYIDVSANGTGLEAPFVSIGSNVGSVMAVGNYLWASTGSYPYAHFTFDRDGARTDNKQDWWTYGTQEAAWDAVNSRLYMLRDNYYPNDLSYEVIDPATGRIANGGESPYHYTYKFQAPIRVSPNGEHILIGTGGLYNRSDLTLARSLGDEIADARWFADGSLVTLSTVNNRTTLRRRAGEGLTSVEQLTYTGRAVSIVGSDTKMAVLVADDSTVRFHIYAPTNDRDGDGVDNANDAFPLDPAAAVDTDRDGYPDAWNTGRGPSDSNSGLTLDAYPQDAACYLALHGNGSCNYSATVPNFVPDQVVHSGDTVYLLSKANLRVYRWSIASAAYLDPYVVGLDQGSQTLAPTRMAYSSGHQRLYLGYSSGAIRYIDVNGSRAELPFAVTARGVGGLAAAGGFLFVQDYDSSNYRAGDYVFNRNGVITEQESWLYYSASEYTWDPVNSRVYFLRTDSPGTVYYATIDQTTGQITTRGEPSYYGYYTSSRAPVRVSPNGDSVLLGSGDIYSHTSLTWLNTLGGEIADARWFNNGSLVALSTANNVTTLRRRGTNLATLEQRSFAGAALRVVGSDTRMAVLVIQGGTVRFHIYVPNDDSDGDGVSNTQDAFPLDPAASVDTDHDGYPDAWNAGRDQSDSTTGLSQDAFAQDSACYLPSHGTGASCNYSATVPNYLPDQVAQNGDTIYLLSTDNRRVYRWSIATASYINPYVVGMDQTYGVPLSITFSSAHQRLYVGYSTGAIQYIDVTSGNNAPEVAWANTPRPVIELAPSANHLVAQDDGPPWTSHHILDSNGVVTARGSYSFSSVYTWDPASSRVYFFRDYFPSDLVYETIDPSTGTITASGETPYNFAYAIQAPIRPSVGGDYVLLGSGDIYNRNGLTWAGSVGASFTDARWFADNSVAILRTGNNQTTLRRLSPSLATLDQRTYTGTALRVLGSDTRMAVLVNNNGTLQFHIYQPSNDTDGDGVTNTQDAFPRDPAASVDTDGDGYPDAWNAGRGPGDSTTPLTLDAYSQDAECYLGSHGDGVNCNYGITMPAYVPDQVLNVGDTIYLLSNANRRVYRWSMATGSYLKPYSVHIDQPFNVTSPTKMAYSSDHQRLYLAYRAGAIQYIDLTASTGASIQFANIAANLEGLAAVGNYVFAQNRPETWSYWATHFILDRDGTVTDQEQNTYYSREYAWDPVSSRVYFFNDGSSFGDLYYEVINSSTGEITSKGESSDYSSNYTFQPPIRVSPDSHTLLLGNGDLYVQPRLTRAGTLGKAIKDARWTDHALVDVDTTDRVEIRDLDTREVLASYQYLGQPIALAFGSSNAFLVHVMNNTTTFIELAFGDQDGDSMPQWWEEIHGFDDSNAADASGDPDGDTVSNADEYLHNSNPRVVDSDGDGLSDDQEILTHSTDPARADTDHDGLNDRDEIVTHQTNPQLADSDGDGYSDYDEVLYGGNPNNQSSVPQPMSSYSQSFENDPQLPPGWSTSEYSNSDWSLDATLANTGTASLKSGSIVYGQTSSVRFRGFFTAGQLNFYARIDSQFCCDRISVLIDGAQWNYAGGWSQWYQHSIPISLGVHTIEWRFERDTSYPQTPGVAHIDDVVFVGQ